LGAKDNFNPVGKPAPPLPRSSESLISFIIQSLPLEIKSLVCDQSPLVIAESINQMQATLVQRTNENEWQSKSMFETHLDYMKGTEPSVKFAF